MRVDEPGVKHDAHRQRQSQTRTATPFLLMRRTFLEDGLCLDVRALFALEESMTLALRCLLARGFCRLRLNIV